MVCGPYLDAFEDSDGLPDFVDLATGANTSAQLFHYPLGLVSMRVAADKDCDVFALGLVGRREMKAALNRMVMKASLPVVLHPRSALSVPVRLAQLLVRFQLVLIDVRQF